MNSSYLSKENLIVKSPADGNKIYIREQHGKFQRFRRMLSVLLLTLFAIVPFIRYHGEQAVYVDLQQQQLHLFSMTLFPQNLLIICLVFILAAFLLFYVTKLYGRVWCGFTCPQTIWMLLFNWVERRVEGSHNQSKALDLQTFTREKFFKKVIKHTLWAAISLMTALVFISYFVKVEQLYIPLFTLESSSLVVSWVVFFAICTYINAGWIREKMCLHMCPYSRFQSAMFDESTKLVSYNHERGENRGKRKLGQAKDSTLGDCVDCNLCVQVCPVGIDIRNGLQYECINCGLCVDACDMTMDKFNYDKGLISFTSERAPANNWKRHLAYGSVISVIILAMIIWVQTWQNFEVNIIRDRQALYRINQNGDIENTFIFKIRNRSNHTKRFNIAIAGLDNAIIVGQSDVEVLPRELRTYSIAVSVSEPLEYLRNDIQFKITDLQSNSQIIKNTSFYSASTN